MSCPHLRISQNDGAWRKQESMARNRLGANEFKASNKCKISDILLFQRIDLFLRDVRDGCEEAKVGEYLDGWYKGTRTSVDSLWFIDLKTQSARRVVPIKDVVNRDVDVIDMHADITGTYLAFINKIDRSLWLYTLK